MSPAGRPPKPEADRLSAWVAVRFTTNEHIALERTARVKRKSVSGWLRMVALEAMKRGE
jgi:hypothetical protein